jgi:O-antigen ligase
MESLSDNLGRAFIFIRLKLLLVLSVILGGNAQYTFEFRTPLIVVSGLILALSFAFRPGVDYERSLNIPGYLLLGFCVLYGLFLIPLPPDLWTMLPGRSFVSDNFEQFGLALPWMPMSLAPQISLFSAFNFIPLIALGYIAYFQAEREELQEALLALMMIMCLSFLLGILQITEGRSAFYLHDFSNFGLPVGFFSNRNHFATLAIMVLPIAIYYTVFGRHLLSRRKASRLYRLSMIATVIMGIITILLTGSNAGFALFVFAILVTAIICLTRAQLHPAAKRVIPIFGIPFAGVIIYFLLSTNQVNQWVEELENESSISRVVMTEKTLNAAQDFAPIGAGPGTFRSVYRLTENPDTVSVRYVNEAHNDYAQIYLEFGVLGGLLVAGFILWFLFQLGPLFIKKESRSRSIIGLCLMIPLLHSMADYPMRTLSVAMCFLFFLVMFCRMDKEV